MCCEHVAQALSPCEALRRASPGSGLLRQARQEPVGLMREAGCPDLGHEECHLFQSRIFVRQSGKPGGWGEEVTECTRLCVKAGPECCRMLSDMNKAQFYIRYVASYTARRRGNLSCPGGRVGVSFTCWPGGAVMPGCVATHQPAVAVRIPRGCDKCGMTCWPSVKHSHCAGGWAASKQLKA